MNKYLKSISKENREEMDNNIIKSENNILRQKIKGIYERLIAYGFFIEIKPEVYQKTEVFDKYLKDGAKFDLEEDEELMKFLLDNHELFLKVIGDEYFRKLKITNETLKEYVANYIKKSSSFKLPEITDNIILQFIRESNLSKEEIRDMENDPLFKEVFRKRIHDTLQLLKNFGLVMEY